VSEAPEVIVYTDGACKGNPGPGGFGAFLRKGSHERELIGWERETTNNRMELMAAIAALEALTRPCQVHIHSDSTYVIKGMTEWMPGWIRKRWKKVKNVDLWKRLKAAAEPHQVRWSWVEAHAGIVDNERVDELASNAAIAQGSPAGDWETDASGASASRRLPG